MNNNLIALVREYSNRIKNGRKPEDVLNHLRLEVKELDQEFDLIDKSPGVDGISGECVDVILCALDLIFMNSPDWTDEQILEYANKKCQKWENKYRV